MKPALERMVGRLLRSVHAGQRRLAWNHPVFAGVPETLCLESPAFAAGASIPARHAGRGVGQNVSPPLRWSGLPAETAALLLLLEDPDAPLPRPVLHLLALLDPAAGPSLPEGALAVAGGSVRLGRGLFGRIGYAGPRPLRGHGPHRYVFELFALSRRPEAGQPPDLAAVLAAATGHVLAKGRLTGLFERI